MPQHLSWGRVRRLAATLMLLAAVLLAASPGVALAQDGAPGTTIHVVAWGETLSTIAQRYGVSVDAIITANNVSSPDLLYAGQELVIPGAAYTAPATASGGEHVVRPGETLFRISQRYGVSVDALVAANQITDRTIIYSGQVLAIPGAGSPAPSEQPESAPPPATAPTPPSTTGVHTVQAGETLSQIARRYGVSVASLASSNNLANPSLIYAGQQLQVAGASAAANIAGYTPDQSGQTHTVQAGETLFSIATRYGLSSWVLAQVNNISNPALVYPGQSLTIPAPDALSSLPQAPAPAVSNASQQRIVVDVSEQRTYVYQNGQLVWTFVVSTGMPGSATARGTFEIQNKIPNAYASTWDLQMPYWLGIYWAGPLQNGFHALPILSNGQKLWEGLLGSPASYGCIILSDADARTLYEWVQIGTPVIVQD